MFDIISIGDATLDTFVEIEEASVTCSLNKKDCQLCLNYADKIPIKSLIKKTAGNAANNAIGSSRLKMNAAFWTILGEDETARLIQQKMRAEGVSCKYVRIQKKSNSNYTVVLNYKGERTQLVYRVPRDYDHPPRFDNSRWIYLTSMGENNYRAYDEIITTTVKNDTSLAYNPERIQIKCNLKKCIDIFSFTKVLFVNKEEAQLILKSNESSIRSLLRKLKKHGPEIVVITDGVKGSYVYSEEGTFHLPIFDGPFVERTGAGDAYATGFIAALFHKKSVQEAMVWGTINAGSVVQFVGPQDGLLTLSALRKLLIKNPSFKPRRIT